MMNSKYLTPAAIKGLNKIGNIYMPDYDGFPSFTRLGCAESVDRVLEDIPASDREGLGLLFTLFSFTPSFLLGFFFSILERVGNRPFMGGSAFRQIRFGVRGILFSLYYSGWHGEGYSGKTPIEILDCSLTILRN